MKITKRKLRRIIQEATVGDSFAIGSADPRGTDHLFPDDPEHPLNKRDELATQIRHASKDIFIPVTVGGGIRKIEDAEKLFLNGADKIAINSAAVRQPSLINDLVKNFGSQAVVVSIQAKKIDEDKKKILEISFMN